MLRNNNKPENQLKFGGKKHDINFWSDHPALACVKSGMVREHCAWYIFRLQIKLGSFLLGCLCIKSFCGEQAVCCGCSNSTYSSIYI